MLQSQSLSHPCGVAVTVALAPSPPWGSWALKAVVQPAREAYSPEGSGPASKGGIQPWRQWSSQQGRHTALKAVVQPAREAYSPEGSGPASKGGIQPWRQWSSQQGRHTASLVLTPAASGMKQDHPGWGALPMLRSLWCATQMGHFWGPQSSYIWVHFWRNVLRIGSYISSLSLQLGSK